MATGPEGEIVGVCLNGIMRRDDPEEIFVCPNKKFEKILNLLDTVDKQADTFGQFPDVDQIMLVKILSVDGSWRGRGIAKALIDRTRFVVIQNFCNNFEEFVTFLLRLRTVVVSNNPYCLNVPGFGMLYSFPDNLKKAKIVEFYQRRF